MNSIIELTEKEISSVNGGNGGFYMTVGLAGFVTGTETIEAFKSAHGILNKVTVLLNGVCNCVFRIAGLYAAYGPEVAVIPSSSTGFGYTYGASNVSCCITNNQICQYQLHQSPTNLRGYPICLANFQ